MESGLSEVHVPCSMSAEFSSPGGCDSGLVYQKEIDSLVKLFNEEKDVQGVLKFRKETVAAGVNIQRQKIALFLEGSRLPFSALVKDVVEKLSSENDHDPSKGGAVTLASVRSIVLSLGERVSFGITNPDTDVLEDDSDRSLWRWEVRDLKLIPKAYRDEIVDRRRWLKKIADRVAALAARVESLGGASGASQFEKVSHEKSKEWLSRTDDESAIRAAKITWQLKKAFTGQQSNSLPNESLSGQHTQQDATSKRRKSDPEEKERLRMDKLVKRQLVEIEKEQKRKDREEADRQRQQQRQQDEAERELKRKEREEGERRRQEKKQHEEAEKVQKREAERKKLMALKKQANFMDRFLVKKDQGGSGQCHHSEAPTTARLEESKKSESSCQNEQAVESTAIVTRMDVELKGGECPEIDELRCLHVKHWLNLRSQHASRKPRTWGVRRKPKASVYRELRLQGTVGDSRTCSPDDNHVRKVVENSSIGNHGKRSREELDCSEDIDWKENVADSFPDPSIEELKKLSSDRYHQLRKKKRKLLQFDKSHRPPYYGTFSKTSEFIKPRHPLKQDPMLDYDVDSDEEWEEEDPGESLSDVDKEEEDEKIEIEEIEDDEEGADEFVVPDGYLSEDEGVAMEDYERNVAHEETSVLSPKTPILHNVMSLERLRKVLDSATEHALRSNHPLVISNLGHATGFEVDIPSYQFPSSRTETMCLEALRIRVLVPNLLIGAC